MSVDISQQPGVLGDPKLQAAIAAFKKRHQFGDRLTTEQCVALLIGDVEYLMNRLADIDQHTLGLAKMGPKDGPLEGEEAAQKLVDQIKASGKAQPPGGA